MAQANPWFLPPCHLSRISISSWSISVVSLLTTLFLCVYVKSMLQQAIPFGRLMLLLLGLGFLVSTLGAWWVSHHARSLAYLTVVVCSSLFIPIWHCADALCKLYFFNFILILALYLFILREVTKREPVLISGSSVDCLLALDNDFSMNLPFSLPIRLCLWAINKTCIHR